MVIHRVLDEVFRNGSHVAVLRPLLDTNSGYTGNEVARRAGIHPRSALNALTSLEQLGIVRRQRGGRDHIFTLNRDHYVTQQIIEPAYNAEQMMLSKIIGAIAAVLKRSVLNATIFGSVAKKTETSLSDLDLCCIVKIPAQKESVRIILNDHAKIFLQTYGIRIAPLLLTTKELKSRMKTIIVRDIRQNGIHVTGREIRSLTND